MVNELNNKLLNWWRTIPISLVLDTATFAANNFSLISTRVWYLQVTHWPQQQSTTAWHLAGLPWTRWRSSSMWCVKKNVLRRVRNQWCITVLVYSLIERPSMYYYKKILLLDWKAVVPGATFFPIMSVDRIEDMWFDAIQEHVQNKPLITLHRNDKKDWYLFKPVSD